MAVIAGREGALARAAGLFVATLVAAFILASSSERASGQGGALTLRELARFEMPVHVEDAPGARKLLFVVEQPGIVRVLRKGRVLGKPFLDIRDRVSLSYEEGLLSIAFDPRYKRNRRFFVYYVNSDGNLEVDSFRRKRKRATKASPASRRTLLEIPHPQNSNHNGGQLQFGPDGLLYVGTGDGGGSGDPGENAQDPGSLLGKILRVDPRRKRGYAIPAGNPFAAGGGSPEILALGLRNPWRFSFDRQTGDLTIGDVGQNAWEEIDHLPLDAAPGANFGWDNLEGNHFYEDPGTEPSGYRAPIHEYSGGASVIAGYVVRDRRLPSLAGRLVWADLGFGEIRSLDPDASNPSATDAATGLSVAQPTSFGEGRGGRLYVASLSGAVFQLLER